MGKASQLRPRQRRKIVLMILRIGAARMRYTIFVMLVASTAIRAAGEDAMNETDWEAGTRFFRRHERPIEFQTSDGSLRLANRLVGVEFRRAGDDIRLSRLYGVKHAQDFLSRDFGREAGDLWQIMLRREGGRDEKSKIVGIPDAQQARFRIDEAADRSTLAVDWTGVKLPDGGRDIDVRVTATVKKDDPLTYWRIAVVNRSETWGLWQVRFPMLRLAPIGGDRHDNSFVYNKDRGRVIEDCFDTARGYGHGFHADEPPPTGFGQSNPGSLSMQFQAMYNRKSGAGLYLTTFDGKPYQKHLRLINSSKEIRYEVGHDPANMGVAGAGFEMPYDFAVGPFRTRQ